MGRLAAGIFAYTLLAVLLLPALVTGLWGREEKTVENQDPQEVLEVFRPVLEYGVESDLEDYIADVVAAEMPANFPVEALKAQAVAARTYAVRKMGESGNFSVDRSIGQAYITVEEQKTRWGGQFETYREKIVSAVSATKGEIMVYEAEPILAVFHAESGGKTESSANIWAQDLPYLKSVDSTFDQDAPGFETRVEFGKKELLNKLIGAFGDMGLSVSSVGQGLTVLKRSDAGYVTDMKVGSKEVTGRQVREALGLRSTNFTIADTGDSVVFITKGYGHGAGMSQYGASFLAEDGKSYRDILLYYYTGIGFALWEPKTNG